MAKSHQSAHKRQLGKSGSESESGRDEKVSNRPKTKTMSGESVASHSRDSIEKKAKPSHNSTAKNSATLHQHKSKNSTKIQGLQKAKSFNRSATIPTAPDSAVSVLSGVKTAKTSPRSSSQSLVAVQKSQPQTKSRNWLWLGLISSLLVILALLAGVAFWPSNLPEDRAFTVEEGASLSLVARDLSEAGAIPSPIIFKLLVRLQGGGRSIKHGEYLIKSGASMEQIFLDMWRGRVIKYQLTIPEGLRVVDVLAMVGREKSLVGKLAMTLEEGSLYPETYDYSRGYSRGELVAKMQSAMSDALAKVWQGRAANLPYRSPKELLTMASIIERETPQPDERSRVAAVYLNRLRINMKLQADPTVVYGLGLKQPKLPLKKMLLTKDLALDSPYNTYRNFGLPPGPIANPSLASLQAAAHPITSKELYFVANGKGGHNFATNLVDHNRNVAVWRKLNR